MTVSRSKASSAAQPPLSASFTQILIVGFLICLVMSWTPIKTTWLEGTYHDTDDAMRMVQVRDWLAGQAWYDLRAMRLDPPGGSLMHWSRVVDLPIGGLIRLFGLFAEPQSAERLTRIVLPLILQGLLLWAAGLCGRLLAGAFGAVIAVFLTIASGMSLWQFVPGRIDHHAPQILLLVLLTFACLCALDPQRPRMAALAGFCAALSLSIAVENLPFILVLMVIFPVAYAAQGAPMRTALGWMGAGWGASLLLLYPLFQAPDHWFVSACDAISAVHMRAGLTGGLAMILLAAFDRWRQPGLRDRLLATGVAGLAAALPMWLDRRCYLDPFSAIDPLVRQLWLANVREALSIPALLSDQPGGLGTWVMAWALGVLAIAAAACMERGLSRARYIALLALTLAGCATAVYMSRSISSVTPLALLGGVWAVTRAQHLCGKRETLAAALLIPTLAPFTMVAWAAAIPLADRPEEKAQEKTIASCSGSDALTPLRNLPRGAFLTLPDLTPFLLLYTDHSAIAAPYHRNNHGNRLMFDTFLASPETAREMMRAAGLRYMALCAWPDTGAQLIRMAPESLAAALASETPPPWLRPIEMDTPLRLLEVVGGE